MSNLVSNAIRNTERGGVLIGFRRRGDRLLMQVADTGKGIAAQHREKIFDEFYQVDNPQRDRRKGFGLGLVIVRRLCEALGSELSLASTPGRGSVFSVGLAAARPTMPALPEAAGALPAASGGVLIVDDDEAVRDALARLFAEWRIDARVCTSSAEAMDAIAAEPDRWQRFIFDLRLGRGMNGLQLAVALRERAIRSEAILLVTGEGESPLLGEARELGLQVLRKPVKPLRLRAFLAAAPASPQPAASE